MADKILIAISHRPKILEICDTIVLMQGGEIAGSGSYQDLIMQSAGFRELIQKETDAQQVDATLD